MTQQARNASSQNAGDVPKLGLIRPPLVYTLAIIIGATLQRFTPVPIVPQTVATPLGASLVILAATLLLLSVAKFRAAGTPVPAREPTTAIVSTGPYRFSRNPIYLAFSLFQFGLAVWLNSAWLLMSLIVAVALMNFYVIPREERYLARRFGEEYLSYMRSVRRWF